MWLVVAIVLVLCALVKPFSSLMYGLSDPTMRWTFVLEFIFLLLSAKYLDDEPDKSTERRTGAVYLMLCAVDMVIIAVTGTVDFEAHRTQVIVIAVCFVCSILLYLCMLKRRKTACLLSMVQLIVFSAIMLNKEYIYDPDTYRVLAMILHICRISMMI